MSTRDPAFAPPLTPPYYAVIFSSRRTIDDDAGYAETAERMVRLAERQPGYLGIESARGTDRFGITVSYWESGEAIKAWKEQLEHQAAQRDGQARWYEYYELRVAKVERGYGRDG